jgi:folate-dependent phosphoribosylglycinamide formyltransferase PurN
MQVKSKWVAFFSQSGSEITNLIKLGYNPDLVVTDNLESFLCLEEFFKGKGIAFWYRPINFKKTYLKVRYYDGILHEDDVVTLHGWLNIVPAQTCDDYVIYNGHPGHIIDYPELKGKDPQERAFNDIKKYKKIGCVLHRVTAEIDNGEVVVVAEQDIKSSISIGYLPGMFSICSKLSLVTWECFFRNIDIILETDLNYDGTFKNDREKRIPIYC